MDTNFDTTELKELTLQEMEQANGGGSSFAGEVAYWLGRAFRGIVEANKTNPYMDKF